AFLQQRDSCQCGHRRGIHIVLGGPAADTLLRAGNPVQPTLDAVLHARIFLIERCCAGAPTRHARSRQHQRQIISRLLSHLGPYSFSSDSVAGAAWSASPAWYGASSATAPSVNFSVTGGDDGRFGKLAKASVTVLSSRFPVTSNPTNCWTSS